MSLVVQLACIECSYSNVNMPMYMPQLRNIHVDFHSMTHLKRKTFVTIITLELLVNYTPQRHILRINFCFAICALYNISQRNIENSRRFV